MLQTRNGQLSTYTRIMVKDIYGVTRYPRISLGKCHDTDIEQAAVMVKAARADNKELSIEANFMIRL